MSSPGSGVLDDMLNTISKSPTSKDDKRENLLSTDDTVGQNKDLASKVDLLMDMMNEIAPVVKSLKHNADTNVSLDSESETEKDDDEPQSKKTKTVPNSTVDSLVTEVTEDEPTGPAISEKIAKVLDNILAGGLNEQATKRRKENIHRPSNTKLLAQTRVNPEIWEIASKPIRSMDSRLQSLQDTLVKGLTPLADITGKIGESIDSGADLPTKEALWENLSNSLLLVTAANHSLNICRRDMFKSDLDDKYKVLCNNKKSVGSELFGDDLAERLKTVTESNKASKQLTKAKTTLSKRDSKSFLSQGGRSRRPYFHNNYQSNRIQGNYQRVNRYPVKESNKTTPKAKSQTARQS